MNATVGRSQQIAQWPQESNERTLQTRFTVAPKNVFACIHLIG